MNLPEIKEAINRLEQERASLALPSLAAIESRIQSLGARCIVDPSLKGELEQTIFSKGEAERHHQRAKEIGNELVRLRADLELAEQFERVAVAQEATKRCEQAYLEYKLASMQCARAFRRVLNTNMAVSNIKGAVTAPLDLRLHLPALWSPYWAGCLGEHMIHAKLPFENSEEQQNG